MKDQEGCTLCNGNKQVEAKVIEKEMARLDTKKELIEPEDFLWGDYDALRDAMRKACQCTVLSESFCQFTQRHRTILVRLIKEGGHNETR